MNKLLFIANLLALSFMSFGLMSCSDKDDNWWRPDVIRFDKNDLVFEPTASSDSVEFLVEKNGFRPIGYVTDATIQIGDGDIPQIFNPTGTVGGYRRPANSSGCFPGFIGMISQNHWDVFPHSSR